MAAPRTCAVLFVDVSGSTRLYERLGNVDALDQISSCLSLLVDATTRHGGRVVKHTGDGLMCAFADADSALRAAEAMQTTMRERGRSGGATIGVRVGCHFGEVLENAGDLFGDAVNVAARVAEVAQTGEIIATELLANRLSEPLRENLRVLDPVSVRGRLEPVPILEYVWDGSDKLTSVSRVLPAGPPTCLGLILDGRQFFFDGRDGSPLVLGRDRTCGVTVDDSAASRRHATIERRGDKYVLIDHSSNGTYVAFDDAEICLRREQLILPRRGRIALGHSTGGERVSCVAFFLQ